MAMRVDTFDEDLITCQICLYEFDQEIKKPKFLQCSHTICLECFQATRRQDTITCPFCRTVTSKYNRNGAEWILPTNQYVLKLIKMNRTEAISMPSTATVRKSVEEEADEQLIPAVAISARVVEDEEYNSNLMKDIHQSLLNQQQEHVIATAAATAQPANEDEQLRLALDMSRRDMEQEALNEAMRQNISNQQQRVRRSRDRRSRRDRRSVNRHGESQRNAVAATPACHNTPVPNSTIDELSNAEMFSLLLFCSSVLYYAFLLFRQLLTFFCYRSRFALRIVFMLVNIAFDSSRVNLFVMSYGLASSYDVFFLLLEMWTFFFRHLELLLVIAFLFFLVGIHVGWVSDQTRHHRTVTLSNTF